MFRWYVRYMPYAVVVWLCRRHSERFYSGSLLVTNPFKGEFVGWPPASDPLAQKYPTPSTTSDGEKDG